MIRWQKQIVFTMVEGILGIESGDWLYQKHLHHHLDPTFCCYSVINSGASDWPGRKAFCIVTVLDCQNTFIFQFQTHSHVVWAFKSIHLYYGYHLNIKHMLFLPHTVKCIITDFANNNRINKSKLLKDVTDSDFNLLVLVLSTFKT